jgi:L-serine kinase (ADP)
VITKYTTTTRRSDILVPIGLVYSHARYDQHHTTESALMILANGYFTHPICLDRQTMTLVDGHHRYRATQLLGFAYVPSALVAYWSDDIRVAAWRDGEQISRQDVFVAAKSGNLMPVKTSRHFFLNPKPAEPEPKR